MTGDLLTARYARVERILTKWGPGQDPEKDEPEDVSVAAFYIDLLTGEEVPEEVVLQALDQEREKEV